ncbi:MAG: DUF1592 domain-containing protein, partial [Myxococcota bacterium]
RFGCPTLDASCASTLVATLGERAFRRPLEAAAQARYEAFLEASAIVEGSFAQGAAQLVAAMLQSPRFLHRIEASQTPDGSGDVPLDGWEVASRLSYLLWNSMPDDALFEAARTGALGTAAEVEAQVDRMLAAPAAGDVLLDFHAQWLDTDAWGELVRAEPLPDGLEASLREQNRRFIAAETLGGGGLRELLTSSQTYVDANLAAHYDEGLEAPELGFAAVALDPTRYAGFLTQPGFLAHFSDFAEPSSIRRGVFVHRRVLCTELDVPPGDADLEVPPATEARVTNRERVEAHTAAEGCQRCHAQINPAGFAFENFDAVGRWRDEDNGSPVDATASVPFRGAEDLEADGPVAMAHALAERPEAHRCYATWWFRYANGRDASRDEACLVDALGEASRREGVGALGLLERLAKSRALRYRAGEETP